MRIPSGAATILEKLNKAGFEAYVVGGCVRDALLGRIPHDWDICTSATPDEVSKALPDVPILPTGIKYGTVTAIVDGQPYEVTTFRCDGAYRDGRHPDGVRFVGRVEDDLARRDFTINAMAYHPKRGLIDPYGGRNDLSERVIRCVGDARERFQEDGLRILRAMRFASVLDFEVEVLTSSAMKEEVDRLDMVAPERLGTELRKLIYGQNAATVLLEYKDILFHLIPELAPTENCEQNNRFHYTTVFMHTLDALENVNLPNPRFPRAWADEYTKMALLFHDIGKPQCKTTDENGYDHFYKHPAMSAVIAESVLMRFRYSREYIDTVLELVESHDVTLTPTKPCVRRLLLKHTPEQLHRLFKLRECDNRAHTPAAFPKFENTEKTERVLEEVLEEQSRFSLKDLAVKGGDLKGIGVAPGPGMGKILAALLDAVIEEQVPNEKEPLLALAKTLNKQEGEGA